MQAHTWPSQRSVQQSPFLSQLCPLAEQAQVGKNGFDVMSQLPEQQSCAVLQTLPPVRQQAPSTQVSPFMQLCAVQPLPGVTQLWPCFMKPLSQVKSHCPPTQVAVPFCGTGHGSHELPHDCGLALARHMSPQAWKPASQVTPHTSKVQVAVPCCGIGHAEQLPQCCGSLEMSTQRLPHGVGAVGGQ